MTQCILNLFEKTFHVQRTEEDQIMTPLQFGLGKNCSRQDALLYVTESSHEDIDSKKNVYAALLDLSKYFDFISHIILVRNLRYLGFSTKAKTLFECFKNFQRVNENGIFWTGYSKLYLRWMYFGTVCRRLHGVCVIYISKECSESITKIFTRAYFFFLRIS